ncbi:ornithine decarboxylase antizyme-domain-containing protein [Obelidium mucronatum]|nr:ornithine decarboxylase antizyme-domain-containing protein [Obelidium mucronatum]
MIVTSNNITSIRSLTTEFPSNNTSNNHHHSKTSSIGASNLPPASPGDVVRTAGPWVRKAGGVPDIRQRNIAPGGRHRGGGGGNGVVSVGGGGGGVGVCGVSCGVGAVVNGGGGNVEVVGSGDCAGSLSFINEMRSALDSACEKPVQVVSINARTQQTGEGNVRWPGFLTDKKTLFIHVPETASFSTFLQPAQGSGGFGFRESVVAVLELAEDVLGVQSLVVCLDKERADLATLVRSFLFVGFELVHPSVYEAGSQYVLVGSSF